MMNKAEVAKVTLFLKATYPLAYKNINDDLVIEAWFELFADDDAGLVVAAVKAFASTDNEGFPPTPGKIKNMIYKLTNPQVMTEQEAWNVVRKSLSYYHAGKKYNALPNELKQVVTVRNLKEWALMDESQVNTIVASNFMRSYRAKIGNLREETMMPESVKKVIASKGFEIMLLGTDESE